MTGRTEQEILEDFLRVTKGTIVQPTEQDREDLETLRAAEARSKRDVKLSLEVREKTKRERALLAQARGEIESGREI